MQMLPGSDVTGRPLIHWGLNLAVIEALDKNIKDSRNWTDFDAAYVGPERPQEQSMFPALIVSIGSTKISAEGLAGYDDYAPDPAYARETYFSEGQVQVEIFALNKRQAWSLQDFITQRYMGRRLYQNSFFRAGEQLSGVGMGYNSGVLSWSTPQYVSPPWTSDESQQIVSVTATWDFFAEHHVYYEQARVSEIDIETYTLGKLVYKTPVPNPRIFAEAAARPRTKALISLASS